MSGSGHRAHEQPQPVPELPKSTTRRAPPSPRAEPVHPPRSLPSALDGGAELPHGAAGIEHVLAFERPGSGLADGQRPQDQRAVRDGLVARDARTAAEGTPSGGQQAASRTGPREGSLQGGRA